MKNKKSSNDWVIKQLKRQQRIQEKMQQEQNALIIGKLETLERKIDMVHITFGKSVNYLDSVIESNSDSNRRTLTEGIASVTDALSQMQELIKILVANQLIDEI